MIPRSLALLMLAAAPIAGALDTERGGSSQRRVAVKAGAPGAQAVRKFGTVLDALASEKSPSPRQGVYFEVARDEAGAITEVVGVISLGAAGHLLLAIPDDQGDFEITHHAVVDEDGGVAEVLDSNTACFELQSGSSVRVMCICRKSAQEKWEVCFDTGWLAAAK